MTLSQIQAGMINHKNMGFFACALYYFNMGHSLADVVKLMNVSDPVQFNRLKDIYYMSNRKAA